MWKRAVQNYRANLMLNVYRKWAELMSGNLKWKGYYEFDLFERGKLRHIKSEHISERPVQRCFTDNFLIPLMRPHLIYDNGASLKGKGTDFTIRRFSKHLQEALALYGPDAELVLYDFSGYFDSIDHEALILYVKRFLNPGRLLDYTIMFIRRCDAAGVGLGLGSQVNQILAVSFPSPIDHYFKAYVGLHSYDRYMDDGGMTCKDNIQSAMCVRALQNLSIDLNLKLNPDKIHVQKITRPFVWLKVRWQVMPSGRILKRITRANVSRERRKLKRLRRRMDAGMVTQEAVQCNWASWRGYTKRFRARKTVYSMSKLYNELFPNEGGSTRCIDSSGTASRLPSSWS